MRTIIQLVNSAKVTVDGRVVGSIDRGLVVLLGVARDDTEADALYLAEKTVHLRIFPDENGMMNRSVTDVAGEVLVVSQFTLLGDCRKGRRPSYAGAAPPGKARELYEIFIREIEKHGLTTARGQFQAMMEVSLVNTGPVTILIDSNKLF